MKISRIAVLLALPLAIAACGAPDSGSAQESAPVAAVTGAAAKAPYEALLKDAAGFTVGSMTSTRHIYVIFDPQCPHCGELWRMTKPILNQVRITWVPVNLMRKISGYQGAALIGANNPAIEMDAHEIELAKGQGGMTIDESLIPPARLAKINKNTDLFKGFGMNAVPLIVGKHAKTGEIVVLKGAQSPEVLADSFGWGGTPQ